MANTIATHNPVTIGQRFQPPPTPQATPASSGGHVPVMAAAGTGFAGSQISAAPAPAQNASTAKSFSLSAFIKDSAPVQKAAQLIASLAQRTGHGGIASVAGSLKTGALEAARLEQSSLRADLSATDPAHPSILDTVIDVKGRSGASVTALLEYLRVTLGGDKRISSGEMLTYVAMGERICDAVRNSGDGKPPLTTTVNGKTIAIPSNVDTARAVSWYMQAKAMVDNADANRDPVSVGKSGSTLIKDPGSKLYNFLSSAPSAYGRTSTHLKAHSENAGDKMGFVEGFRKTGIVSGLSVGKGGALQHGIEDYSSKMPGGGGTLLFDRIKADTSGDQLLFMKLEPVGTPTSFSFFGRHVDPAEGFVRNLQGLASVAGRNVMHGVHLVESIAAKHGGSEDAYRGEKMDKGPSKVVYKQFSAALEAANWLSEGEKDDIARTVRINGVTGLLAAVGDLETRAADGDVPNGSLKPFQDAKQALLTLVAGMGSDLGIDRRGNEVHATY